MLAVGGGASINMLQFRLTQPGSSARDIHQLVKALNRMRRNNRLYALLMAPQRSFVLEGDEYPSPPPSLIQTFMSDPAAASSVNLSGTSVVGDYEGAASSFMIHGQKTLLLRVVGQASSAVRVPPPLRRRRRRVAGSVSLRRRTTSFPPCQRGNHERSGMKPNKKLLPCPVHSVASFSSPVGASRQRRQTQPGLILSPSRRRTSIRPSTASGTPPNPLPPTLR